MLTIFIALTFFGGFKENYPITPPAGVGAEGSRYQTSTDQKPRLFLQLPQLPGTWSLVGQFPQPCLAVGLIFCAFNLCCRDSSSHAAMRSCRSSDRRAAISRGSRVSPRLSAAPPRAYIPCPDNHEHNILFSSCFSFQFLNFSETFKVY